MVVVIGVLIGGVPDNGSGSHTQGGMMTQKEAYIMEGGVPN